MTGISFSVFADIMLWGTAPLMGALGFWEHHLALSAFDHKIVQMLLVVVVFGWAYFWNSVGEYSRMAYMSGNDGQLLATKKNISSEIKEKYHVSHS